MLYLQTSEYLLHGLDAETPESLVTAACAMVDAFCRRPSLQVTAYVERLRARQGQALRLSHGPVVAVTSCRVRLRRPDWLAATPLQRDAAAFGLSGTWTGLDPATLTVYANDEVEMPGHLFGMRYDEAEVSYTAGHADVPANVKLAVAQVVKNAQATPGLNVKRQQVDAMELEYFAPGLLDDETKRLLRPYVSTRLA